MIMKVILNYRKSNWKGNTNLSEELNLKVMGVGDHILVKLCSKKEDIQYIALVENIGKNEPTLSYLRLKGKQSIFLSIPEKCEGNQKRRCKKLCPTTSHRGMSF